VWRATGKKFPPGPSDGLKRWSLGPLNDNPLEYFTKIACAYGDIAGLRILNFKTIFINHPDLIEEVLVTNARKYSKGRVLRANRHVFGEGLLTSEGDFWLRQRRLAQRGRTRRTSRDDAAHASDCGKDAVRRRRRTRRAGGGEIAGTAAGNRRQFSAHHLCAALAAHARESAREAGSGADRKDSLPHHWGAPRFRPRRRRSAVDASLGPGRRWFANDRPAAS